MTSILDSLQPTMKVSGVGGCCWFHFFPKKEIIFAFSTNFPIIPFMEMCHRCIYQVVLFQEAKKKNPSTQNC